MGRGKTRKQKKINILKKKRKYLCPRKPKEGREPSNNDSVIVLEETTPSPEADQERLQQRSSRSIKKFVSPLELSKSVRQMIKIKKRKREKKRKEKNKFVRLLFKNENSPLLSPTSRRPILGLNTIDEFNFKLFRHKLRTHDCQLNSTTLSDLNTPRKQNILTDNVPNVLETIEHLGGTCNKNLPVKIQQSVRENTLKSKHNETTREEGEITQTTIASNDDDCICIEEEIEEIIIDDTEDNGIFFKDTSKMQFIDLTPKRTSLNQSKPIPSPASNGNDNDNEVIVIDESFVAANRKSSKTPKKTMDESVVFISETQPDYIPLVSNNTRKSFKILPESTPKKQIHRDSLFSKSEKKELASYNANAYNPNAIKELEERRQNPKRMVIIDGSNVAYAHSRKQTFSVKGLQICIEYFKKMGHEVKAVIPLYRLHKSTDPNALELLHREGVIVLTPCKNLPGLSSSSYDDRFILQLASELDAAIVSNDNYRDLINENSAFKKLIENRVIGYTWCDDVFIIPKDPYGKFGPTLHSILNRQIEDSKS